MAETNFGWVVLIAVVFIAVVGLVISVPKPAELAGQSDLTGELKGTTCYSWKPASRDVVCCLNAKGKPEYCLASVCKDINTLAIPPADGVGAWRLAQCPKGCTGFNRWTETFSMGGKKVKQWHDLCNKK